MPSGSKLSVNVVPPKDAADLEFIAKLNPEYIIVVTETGKTARLISKYCPSLPILALSDSVRTVREMALVWGVRSYHVPQIHDLQLEDRAMKAVEVARKIGYLDDDDRHVCVLSASNYRGVGLFTGAYDVSKLVELNLI